MTKEGMIRKALDDYDDKMARLEADYDWKYDYLPVNKLGEVKAEALLGLNMWKLERENKIKAEMVAAVMEMER